MENTETRVVFKHNEKELILLGTAHVSKESVEEAVSLVNTEKPDVVCVELDEGRYASLSQKDVWEKLDVVKVIRSGRGFLLAANLVLAGFQRRLGDGLGVKPGEEMKSAVCAARENGVPFVLCDREVHVTLRRAWGSCGFWGKCKLAASLFSSAFSREKLNKQEIENLKRKSELDGMMNELSSYLPSIKKVFIDERDHYLASKIWEAFSRENVNRAAAIVGAGHLSGLAARLEEFASAEDAGEKEKLAALSDVSSLNEIPPPGFLARALPWMLPAVIAALITAGFLRFGVQTGLESLLRWFLWNGSLAAAGAVLAAAHPIAVLAAFVGAPIGTISPFLSVGLFSGAAQAFAHRPRVSDAENLNEDAASLKGLYKNRITHILVVFFLSSLGGAAGNIISIPALAKILF
ncbi:MAG: TraB/GumN family protein [Spirochaetaceae bacterium]|jgi:pheromone shutdown-related protein TraB|nr:TraB/GumN family protein [Spirochaetaceae bacterium]